MGTRCLIGEYTKEGIVASYCHYDGYISHTGAVLEKHYNTPELAHEIANIGYASFLYETFKETEDLATHKDQPTIEFKNVGEYVERGDEFGAEYLYLWDGNAWFVSNLYSDNHAFEAVEEFVGGSFEKDG